jgi:tRNA A37 threonylcarbamoyladenosine modification protein TsaB
LIEVLVITISNPLLVGIYENKNLIKEISLDGLTSDKLPILFKDLLKEFDIKSIAYVNTPGSFMSIKIAYIFLKTICQIKNIDFLAIDGFTFNQNSPIKALGKKYFINDNGLVKVDFLQNVCKIQDFKLPKSVENIKFYKDTLPIYNLPAV